MWTSEREAVFREMLEQPEANALIDDLANRTAKDERAENWAQMLGLLDAAGNYTEDGYIVSDSCREFKLWNDRNREFPHLDAHPELVANRLKSRRVVEIGAGSGVNVLSIQALGAETIGVEPVAAYVAMGGLLAAHAGHPAPDLRVGSAEMTTLEDSSVDVVLCISSYNYFDIDKALTEMARILRPGGEVYLISAIFRDLSHTAVPRLFKGPSRKKQIMLLSNSIWFALTGQRLIPQKPGYPTARPVYATVHQLRRLAHNAGLVPDERVPPTTIGHIFRATKPAAVDRT